MNRRSFIQSMAAAFGSVTTGVKLSLRDEAPVVDYSLFADVDGYCSLYSLATPFNVRGAIYATDSRVLVTHPGEWSGESEGRLPAVDKLSWGEFDRTGWKPLGAPVYEGHKGGANCRVCRGVGLIGKTTECACCNADEYEYDDFNECFEPKACRLCVNGRVGTACPAGCVRGRVDYIERIGSVRLCPDYMSRMRTLGDIEYRLINAPVSKGFVYGDRGDVLLVRGPREVKGMLCGLV